MSEPTWDVKSIAAPRDHEGPVALVSYGPAGDQLPEAFDAIVEFRDRPLRLRISATFDGRNPVCARSVSLERTDGGCVTAEDMAGTRLAAVMGSVVAKATRRGQGPVEQGGRGGSGPATDEELFVLARMYWFEFVSWGKPRQMVMNRFELPRSTANVWIRRARERYDLPGPHSDLSGS